jgi:hypothetical protein
MFPQMAVRSMTKGNITPLAAASHLATFKDRENEHGMALNTFSPSQEFLDRTQSDAKKVSKIRLRSPAFVPAPASKRSFTSLDDTSPFDSPFTFALAPSEQPRPFLNSSAALSSFKLSSSPPAASFTLSSARTRVPKRRGQNPLDISSEVNNLSRQLENHHVSPRRPGAPIMSLDPSQSILNPDALQKLQTLYQTKQTVAITGDITTASSSAQTPAAADPSVEIARRLVNWSSGIEVVEDMPNFGSLSDFTLDLPMPSPRARASSVDSQHMDMNMDDDIDFQSFLSFR